MQLGIRELGGRLVRRRRNRQSSSREKMLKFPWLVTDWRVGGVVVVMKLGLVRTLVLLAIAGLWVLGR
jgi:hypothetical protein